MSVSCQLLALISVVRAPIWAVFDDPMPSHGAEDFVHGVVDCSPYCTRDPCLPYCPCATVAGYCVRDDNCRYRAYYCLDSTRARRAVAGPVLAIQNLRRLDLKQE